MKLDLYKYPQEEISKRDALKTREIKERDHLEEVS